MELVCERQQTKEKLIRLNQKLYKYPAKSSELEQKRLSSKSQKSIIKDTASPLKRMRSKWIYWYNLLLLTYLNESYPFHSLSIYSLSCLGQNQNRGRINSHSRKHQVSFLATDWHHCGSILRGQDARTRHRQTHSWEGSIWAIGCFGYILTVYVCIFS